MVVTIAVAIAIAQWGIPLLFNYRVTGTHVEFVLFGRLVVWRWSAASIAKIEVVPFWRLLPFVSPNLTFLAFRLGNRLWAPRGVMVRRNRGLVGYAILSPDRPEEFVKQVQAARKASRP
jgi:hypothetical protein